MNLAEELNRWEFLSDDQKGIWFLLMVRAGENVRTQERWDMWVDGMLKWSRLRHPDWNEAERRQNLLKFIREGNFPFFASYALVDPSEQGDLYE